MSQGYAGLPKSRPDEIADEANPKLSSYKMSKDVSTTRMGGLHIVEVERRAPARVDVSRYRSLRPAQRGPYFAFKRVFDIAGASLAILLLCPLILAIVAISFTTPGSPLFKHRRVGRDGVFFDCLKFRTMVKNADRVLEDLLDSDRQIKEEWLQHHKLKDDPRITRVGRFLRRTSLDELPQLWNVLRGDMSLVGPRPVVPDELRRYGSKVPVFLSALPGITGLWQVSGRNDTSYRRRVAQDVCYVRSQSFVLDIYILLKTLPAVFAKNGAY